MNRDMIDDLNSRKIIARWVFTGVAMIIIQVLIGGITRLTGSGLSITEWKPIMGIIPPLNENEWQQAFEKYQGIAQFKFINNHFTISDFKFIFFWEWFHRLWARMILGVAFIIPFFYFLYKGHIKKYMYTPLFTLVALGGFEGIIGWIMVKSGLNDENLYVNHIKLSIHFIIAMFIASYATIFGLSLLTDTEKRIADKKLKKTLIVIISFTAIQLVYGAFMAGLKAANAAPTWPLINSMLIPNTAKNINDFILFDKLSIHFIHRTLAYIILVAVILWWLKARKINSNILFNKTRILPLLLVFLQVILGVSSILFSPKIVLGNFGSFELFALLHQLTGMLLLLSLVINVYLIQSE